MLIAKIMLVSAGH